MRDALKCIFIAGLLLMVTFAAGCTSDDGDDGDDDVKPPAYTVIGAGKNDYVNGSNEVRFDMYRELVNSDDNVFFSPYSIAIALGMAYEGARGKTAEEMQSVIELPEDDDARHDCSSPKGWAPGRVAATVHVLTADFVSREERPGNGTV